MTQTNQAGFRVFLLILVLVIFPILSGCTLLNKFTQDKPAEGDNWEDDILWAQECGEDGLRCCLEDPACRYGQECCTDQNNPKRNRCSDNCECGVAGNYCCANNTCNEGLGCDSGFCAPCGELNQPCCSDGGTCGENLLCYQNKCAICGTPGNPCCAGDKGCQNQDKTDRTRTDCIDGLCIYCGTAGKVLCESEPVCTSGNLINNGYCLKCGGPNEPCCNGDTLLDPICKEGLGLECDRGFCTEI